MSFEAEVIPPVSRVCGYCQHLGTDYGLFALEKTKGCPQPFDWACNQHDDCTAFLGPLYFCKLVRLFSTYCVYIQFCLHWAVWYLLGSQYMLFPLRCGFPDGKGSLREK